jgi:P27 family predicted phage terminase small subunit
MVANLGLLTEADVQEFGRLCLLISEARLLRKALDKDGWLIRERVLDSHGRDAGERIRKHPAEAMLRKTEAAILVLSDRFGLNPSSRSRIKVESSANDDDPLQRLMNRAGKDS